MSLLWLWPVVWPLVICLSGFGSSVVVFYCMSFLRLCVLIQYYACVSWELYGLHGILVILSNLFVNCELCSICLLLCALLSVKKKKLWPFGTSTEPCSPGPLVSYVVPCMYTADQSLNMSRPTNYKYCTQLIYAADWAVSNLQAYDCAWIAERCNTCNVFFFSFLWTQFLSLCGLLSGCILHNNLFCRRAVLHAFLGDYMQTYQCLSLELFLLYDSRVFNISLLVLWKLSNL